MKFSRDTTQNITEIILTYSAQLLDITTPICQGLVHKSVNNYEPINLLQYPLIKDVI
jgi:hypothetical protein